MVGLTVDACQLRSYSPGMSPLSLPVWVRISADLTRVRYLGRQDHVIETTDIRHLYASGLGILDYKTIVRGTVAILACNNCVWNKCLVGSV